MCDVCSMWELDTEATLPTNTCALCTMCVESLCSMLCNLQFALCPLCRVTVVCYHQTWSPLLKDYLYKFASSAQIERCCTTKYHQVSPSTTKYSINHYQAPPSTTKYSTKYHQAPPSANHLVWLSSHCMQCSAASLSVASSSSSYLRSITSARA